MSMKVIWKRPDGFHNATPDDYKVITLETGANLWLHKSNSEWYPFRLSGDWAREESTNKMNLLINQLGEDKPDWSTYLLKLFYESQLDDPQTFLNDLNKWLNKVKNHLKGDTWELDIMEQVVSVVDSKIKDASEQFLSQASMKAH